MRFYLARKLALAHNNKTGEAATLDPVHGCIGCELRDAPCYAEKMCAMNQVDFWHPVPQELDVAFLAGQLRRYRARGHHWLRIGCKGDPSLAWETTRVLTQLAHDIGIIPVVVSKLHVPLDRWLAPSTHLQVSVSGAMSPEQTETRLATLARYPGAVMRLVSFAWLPGSSEDALQAHLVDWARARQMNILETPARVYATRQLWTRLDTARYHKHISPMSGREVSEYCAGLLIPGAAACYSTCSPVPTAKDPVGCAHQCLTIRKEKAC